MPTTFLGSPSMISIMGCCSKPPRPEVLSLELDLELANQRLLRAIDVREHLALSPDIFEAGIDERNRAPDHVDMDRLQFLIHGHGRRRSNQVCRNIVIGEAIIDVRTQIRQPPVLIAELHAECRDRMEEDAVGLVLAGRREEVIGGQRGIALIIQVTADAVAGSGLPRKVVLIPAEPARLDVAGYAPAKAEITSAEETTISHRQITADKLEIDMPPGLRPVRGKSDVGRDVLGGVEAEWRPGCHGSIDVAEKPE